MKRYLLLLLLLWRSAALPAAEVKILCTADLHGELARFSALLPAMRRAAGKDALLIDLGDLSQGNFEVARAGFPVMIEALNRAGYEMRVPGNHDFEISPDGFAGEFTAFRGTTLGADWSFGGIGGVPWRLVERGGVRCAVIGLTDPKMPQRTAPDRQCRFEDPISALSKTMKEVRRSRPDVVVLARHAGMRGYGPPLTKLLGEFPEIAVVLGAHSHEEHPGEAVAGAWFVQPGARAASAAMVTVTVDDRSRRITGIVSRLLRPDFASPAPELAELAERIRREAPEERRFPPNSMRWHELLAAALRSAAGADAALTSYRGESGFPAPRTEQELFRRLPYRDEVLCFRLSPQEYRELCRAERMRLRRLSSHLAVSGLPPERAAREVTLAVREFSALSCPRLRSMLEEKPARWRRIPGTVRELCREFLLSGGREPRPR